MERGVGELSLSSSRSFCHLVRWKDPLGNVEALAGMDIGMDDGMDMGGERCGGSGASLGGWRPDLSPKLLLKSWLVNGLWG